MPLPEVVTQKEGDEGGGEKGEGEKGEGEGKEKNKEETEEESGEDKMDVDSQSEVGSKSGVRRRGKGRATGHSSNAGEATSVPLGRKRSRASVV